MVVLDDTGLGRKILGNYESLDNNSEARVFVPEEMKTMYDGLFEDTDYRGVEEVFLNPQSGWAEATLGAKGHRSCCFERW